MLNLYPRLAASSRDDDNDSNVAGNRAFYGIAVVCVAIFLFCVLVATISVWKAFAFAAIMALFVIVMGVFAPMTPRVRRLTARPASPVLALTATARGRQRAASRSAGAPADVPPAFAYVCPLEGGEQAAASCPVCLDDVRGGEMVRQLPLCRHVFHVECIDMWLHSHWTCPLCRCMISPPTTATSKPSEPEEGAESSSVEALSPV
jgi:hypothetical protein